MAGSTALLKNCFTCFCRFGQSTVSVKSGGRLCVECTNKYTKVFCEDESEQKFNAPHHFVVKKANYDNKILCEIHFQEGAIKECGVNGVCNEDLINMVIERLEHFQNSEFKCRENALAITKLEEALLWLRKRTMAREQRGVEGTHIV